MLPSLVAPLVALLAALAHSAGARADSVADLRGGGCSYRGRWFADGGTVEVAEPCLRCSCSKGALACRRRACQPLPDIPPRCHALHRKGACCPEVHCPDGGVMLMEHGASTRFESEDLAADSHHTTLANACVEDGVAYRAGSALASAVACERCFCLRGRRRCVSPRCLATPPGCSARPTAGACCPARYYCDRTPVPHPNPHPHDCTIEGRIISEGEQVTNASSSDDCTQCFCLQGSVHCQHLACAPPLMGCQPLLRPRECCPHQYSCPSKRDILTYFKNAVPSISSDERSFHSAKSAKLITSSSDVTISSVTIDNHAETKHDLVKSSGTTAKVKRKVEEEFTSTTLSEEDKTEMPTEAALQIETKKLNYSSNMETVSDIRTTEQPEGSVRITVNGTINCTAEISSTPILLNDTQSDQDKIETEALSRNPNKSTIFVEEHTFNPNDIITDRNVNGGFDENETFTINVTSSLITNTNHSASKPTPAMQASPSHLTQKQTLDKLNVTNISKDDFKDYDYTEHTLPPSLPNLKIIPFVAADAVVEDDLAPKDTATYQTVDRKDSYPIFFANDEIKEPPHHADRRQDAYYSTQHPVFIPEKIVPQYQQDHDHDLNSDIYINGVNGLSATVDEYTVTALLGNRIPGIKKVPVKTPLKSSTGAIKSQTINLFSPPVETEGGFVPKGPGLVGEYYAVYPSTSPSSVPNLTTSMPLDLKKEWCTLDDGHKIPTGLSVTMPCSTCYCAWGTLHCSSRECDSTTSTPMPSTPTPSSTTPSFEPNCQNADCGEEISTSLKNSSQEIMDTKTNTSNHLLLKLKEIKEESSPVNATASHQTASNPTTDHSPILNKTLPTLAPTPLTTLPPPPAPETNQFTTPSVSKRDELVTTNAPEYEEDGEEEEEEEGFSLGSVLKLLLSEGYGTTTKAPYKKVAATTSIKTTRPTMPSPTTTTRVPSVQPIVQSFKPLQDFHFAPPKASKNPSSINRIDHLVLGEATAIKKTTLRPATSGFEPISSPKLAKTTQRPFTYKSTESTKKAEGPVVHEPPRAVASTDLTGVAGILKLAGCNIYGRMYGVGRIIAELSTACQECRCMESGVQCRPLC